MILGSIDTICPGTTQKSILKFKIFFAKMVEFSKIWWNNDQKMIPTDLLSQYMTFIENTNLKGKINVLPLFGFFFRFFVIFRVSFNVWMKNFHGWYWAQSIQSALKRHLRDLGRHFIGLKRHLRGLKRLLRHLTWRKTGGWGFSHASFLYLDHDQEDDR